MELWIYLIWYGEHTRDIENVDVKKRSLARLLWVIFINKNDYENHKKRTFRYDCERGF